MGLDEMESYRELILENIEYDILLERNSWDKDLLDGYVELMLEVCCSTRESVRICGLSDGEGFCFLSPALHPASLR